MERPDPAMVCGDCAHLAAGTALFTKLGRRMNVGQKRLMGVLTTLFVVRAAQMGQLQRWEVLACKLSDDPFWLAATLLVLAMATLPVPRPFLLALALLSMLVSGVELHPGLLFSALVWLMQTLQLAFELFCGFKDRRSRGEDGGEACGPLLEVMRW